MDKVSMPYLFSFSRYQTKCVIKFLFAVIDVINFILDQALKHWLTGIKRGEYGNTKL